MLDFEQRGSQSVRQRFAQQEANDRIEFILPGGNRASAVCQLARAVCRRAERAIVTAAQTGEVSDAVLRYVNRLSDLLFVLCRVLARANGGSEVMWDRSRFKGAGEDSI